MQTVEKAVGRWGKGEKTVASRPGSPTGIRLSRPPASQRVISVASRKVTVTVTTGSLLIDPGSGGRPKHLPSTHPLPLFSTATLVDPHTHTVVDAATAHHEGFQDEGQPGPCFWLSPARSSSTFASLSLVERTLPILPRPRVRIPRRQRQQLLLLLLHRPLHQIPPNPYPPHKFRGPTCLTQVTMHCRPPMDHPHPLLLAVLVLPAPPEIVDILPLLVLRLPLSSLAPMHQTKTGWVVTMVPDPLPHPAPCLLRIAVFVRPPRTPFL